VEREAFARAWQFLRYTPVAKWTALGAAVLSGLLYVALLLVLGLFADLMVSRGRIPAYRDLIPQSRESFQHQWQALNPEERYRRFQAVGVTPSVAAELAGAELTNTSSKVQALAWRTQVNWILQERVNNVAAAITLPEYRDLPDIAQAGFQKEWSGLTPEERDAALALFSDDEKAKLASADLDQKAQAYEQLWRARLREKLKQRSGDETANAFWADRTSSYMSGAGGLDRELEDRGILSLVVRNEPPEGSGGLRQFSNRMIGGFASIAPWSWRTSSSVRPNFLYFLSLLLGLGIGLALLRALTLYALNSAAAVATLEASNRLRRAVYHHTYRLGRLAFRALGPSEAVGVFTRQIETLHNGLHIRLTVMFREPIKFILLLALALTLNLGLALAFLIFTLLVWLVGGQVAVYFRRQEREATRQSADQLALLQESMMLMRLVKCYLMELFSQSRVERQLSKYTQEQLRRYRGEAIYRPLLIFLGTLAAVVLLYVAGLVVLSGRLGIASAITLAVALVSLYLPLVNWLEQLRLLRKARESAVVVFKFLDRPGEVGQVVGAEFLAPLTKSLVFEDVSLQEPGTGRKLLQDINLTIQAGQRIGIVGPDEMQKHALVYLIPRFLDPTAGEIKIDQHSLRWVTFDSLRAQIAMVMQHNLVFNDTVANNISCGDASYDKPKIIEAAKIAHAHHFIQKLPKGYETVIGEMGHYLSIGEQYRVALARALVRDPALMIVEEPTVPLDDDTKALLDDTFARIMPGRTVIFLPHRVATIRSCDRVFLLLKGRVEAAGEHRELLAQSDLYKHLHYLEFNEFVEQLQS
jgi:ATP-binding cassette subfamily B protein